MKVEVPQFNRCCMCIPLRYGILFWGYLRLLISLYFMFVLSRGIVMMSILAKRGLPVVTLVHFMIIGVILGILLIDITFNTLFIIGAHKKNTKLLHIYYGYCIASLVVFVLLLLVMVILTSYLEGRHDDLSARVGDTFAAIIRSEVISGVLNIVFQFYFIFLLRSEILKLKNEEKFRYVNKCADDKECISDTEPVTEEI